MLLLAETATKIFTCRPFCSYIFMIRHFLLLVVTWVVLACIPLSRKLWEDYGVYRQLYQVKWWQRYDKTAELSHRRPRDAPNIWVLWNVLRVLTTHPATFPEICNGLLFRSILRMCVQNLKFVALLVPEIIGGTQKIWTVPGQSTLHFLPKF